jgi:hypothetical protein
MSKQLDELDELSRKMRRQDAEAIRVLLEKQAEQLPKILAFARYLSMSVMETNVLKLWGRFIKVIPNLFPTAETSNSGSTVYLSAVKEWNAIGGSLLRCKAVLSSQHIRRNSICQPDALERDRLKGERRQILQETRQTLRQLTPI